MSTKYSISFFRLKIERQLKKDRKKKSKKDSKSSSSTRTRKLTSATVPDEDDEDENSPPGSPRPAEAEGEEEEFEEDDEFGGARPQRKVESNDKSVKLNAIQRLRDERERKKQNGVNPSSSISLCSTCIKNGKLTGVI